MRREPRFTTSVLLLALVFLAGLNLAKAQTCQTSADLDEATRSAITTAAQRYFTAASGGDVATLRQNAISSLAADFSGIEGLVKARQTELSGAQPTIKNMFLLDEQGLAPDPHAEFYCGVFGKNGQTPTSAAFYLENLPPGKYAVVLIDAAAPNARTSFSEVLQLVGTDWKLGGLYIKPGQIAGHDGDWFANQARDYKTKGQIHNAWLYYQEARNLLSPLPFMGTLATDKMFDEAQNLLPPDFPAEGKPVDLSAGGATYKLISIYPVAVGNDLDVVVKYQATDVSNTNQSYQDNMAVIKGMLAKYPEFRDAFAAFEARAVDANGRDYNTLLAMKDIK